VAISRHPSCPAEAGIHDLTSRMQLFDDKAWIGADAAWHDTNQSEITWFDSANIVGISGSPAK